VKDLCTRLSFAAHLLKMNERRARALFAAPVDPTFLSAWRDYEERYEFVVSGVWLSDLRPELGATEPSGIPKADLQWDNADDEAEEQAGGIEEAIEFVQFNADQEDRWIDHPEFIERIQDGLAAWERLKQDTGRATRTFDLSNRSGSWRILKLAAGMGHFRFLKSSSLTGSSLPNPRYLRSFAELIAVNRVLRM
jgi:hypothetical protein